MKIGLLPVDSHNFPNLALMKLSAYHKRKGDDVKFVKWQQGGEASLDGRGKKERISCRRR